MKPGPRPAQLMLGDYSVTQNHHICSHSVQRFAIQNSTTLELRLSTASQETFEQVTAGTRWHNKWPRSSRDEHNSTTPSLLPILATKSARRASGRCGPPRTTAGNAPGPAGNATDPAGNAPGPAGNATDRPTGMLGSTPKAVRAASGAPHRQRTSWAAGERQGVANHSALAEGPLIRVRPYA